MKREKYATMLAALTAIAFALIGLPWTLLATDIWPGAPFAPTPPDIRESVQSAALAPVAPSAERPTSDGSGGPHIVDTALAENSWDFTDPAGVPGFGPLDPADAERLLKLMHAPSGR